MDGVFGNAGAFVVTADEAAGLLSISKRHFLRMVTSGRAPQGIRLGRCVRWRRDVLARFIERGCKMEDAA